MKIDFLKQLLKMFDSETWKKFTILQCLKKIKCLSMRHKKKLSAVNVWKECTPSPPWTKNNPFLPIILTLSPATSIKFVKQNVNPSSYHVHAKNQLPSACEKMQPPQVDIPKFNCFYNFYKKKMSQWGMTKMQCLKKHNCMSMRYEQPLPPVSVWKQCTPPPPKPPLPIFF